MNETIKRILGALGWGESGQSRGESEQEAESTFVPSQMDASVLEAHGMETTRAEQELTQLQEKAEQLEKQKRDQ
ncbi:hypothetical protein ACFQJ7_05220 [Halovenus rubra]|uniref:Uncharacterized protein n=2 Tax=Halovenus rubra TaxID=869890 RepID=A0ACC7DYY8_9EURY|nr:hypothetical protein [Halovenus rubra]